MLGSWQSASDDFMARALRRVELVTAIAGPDLVARVGGFFFTRAGYAARVSPLSGNTYHENVDANRVLPALADAPPCTGRGGFLWIYARETPAPEMAKQHSRVAGLDSRFTCRDYNTPSSNLVVLGFRRALRELSAAFDVK